MIIYKWRCPYCGYIHSEPNGTTETEAKNSKEAHIKWCQQPQQYTSNNAPVLPSYDNLIEKWI